MGPNGRWRPADIGTCSFPVMKIAAGALLLILNRHLAGSILGKVCHHPGTYQHIDGRARVEGWIRADELEDDP